MASCGPLQSQLFCDSVSSYLWCVISHLAVPSQMRHLAHRGDPENCRKGSQVTETYNVEQKVLEIENTKEKPESLFKFTPQKHTGTT